MHLPTLECCGNILRGAEHHTGHIKVVRHAAVGEAVVRVHHQEGGPPRVGEQVARIETAVLLHLYQEGDYISWPCYCWKKR